MGKVTKWVIIEDNITQQLKVKTDDGVLTPVCIVSTPNTWKANKAHWDKAIEKAKLIAAAPELLEACKSVLTGGYGCSPSVGFMDELKKRCESAINKAIRN